MSDAAQVARAEPRVAATSGHSVRVATSTCDLAGALSDADAGPYADVRFTREQLKELRYAWLLHDFGKVGVREEVLVTAKELPPLLFERAVLKLPEARAGLLDAPVLELLPSTGHPAASW